MPIHDRHLRRTPFEHGLPDPEFPERRFEPIAREARERGVSLDDPGAFALLERASEALEELRRPAEDAGTLPVHAAFLFHAFHHHRAGSPALLVRADVVRRLIADEPEEDRGAAPGAGLPACSYVQLPQHLVWTPSPGGDVPPQSLDGFFWTVPNGASVHVMGVGGMIADRSGFTVLPVPAAPLADAPAWRSMRMRTDGSPDFSSELPGAELEGLYELRTAGELLKLAARLDAYLARRPGAAPAGGAIVTLQGEE